jgi:DNA-directed RNA polymerase subunit N (RpoN/RPB10)
VLAEAGVSPKRLTQDLLLDPASCCTHKILSEVPKPEEEYVERLEALKAVHLVSPPPFYLTYPGEEVRPLYRKTKEGGEVTNAFIGAEPYYYLVERGEKPETVLAHLHITDKADIRTILSITDRPATEFECPHCAESIPHARFLSHLYKSRENADILLERPDIVQDCCRESVVNIRLTKDEERMAELQAQSAEERFSGVPTTKEPLDVCISCGLSDVRNYYDYEWLVHKGVPSVIALNYFGLYRLCCRQNMINPRIVPSESKALVMRRIQQEGELPAPQVSEFDYQANELPSVSGDI